LFYTARGAQMSGHFPRRAAMHTSIGTGPHDDREPASSKAGSMPSY
jgi:hypothetical protein